MTRTSSIAALLAATLFLAVSCMTVPDPDTVPEGLSIAELNQMAQNEFDQSNYKAAEVYYTLIIERFGADPAALTAAEFEIAHMRIKKEAYADAAARLEIIIARYETSGGAGLPPEYLVLARNDLAKVPEELLSKKSSKPVTGASEEPAEKAAPAEATPAATEKPAPAASEEPAAEPAPAEVAPAATEEPAPADAAEPAAEEPAETPDNE